MEVEKVLSSLDIKRLYKEFLPTIQEKANGEAIVLCPFHNDTNPSLSINLRTGLYHCFGCGEKGNIFSFYMKLKSVNFRTALHEISKLAGVEMKPRVVARYDYKNIEGETVYIKERFEPGYNGKGKLFIFKHLESGKWVNGKDSESILYNLPELAKAEDIIIVEGENKVECLRKWGLVATCNDNGAGKCHDSYGEHFTGKRVIILPDNDSVGMYHASNVARSLYREASDIKIVELPGLEEKEDIINWKRKGGTKEQLIELIKTTSLWEPEKESTLIDRLPTMSDLYDSDDKVEYCVDKLIVDCAINLVYGKAGIGKTWLELDMGGCIADDKSFCALETRQREVVYIDFENSKAVLHDRAQVLGRSNLRVWHPSHDTPPPKLDKDDWILYKQLPEGSVLIFDSLRASQHLDENSSKDMSLIMGRLKKLRDMGYTIILLHHTPKSNEGVYKGSTAILDLCDHSLCLERVKKDKETPTNNEDDCLYRFGVKDKTRYAPHHIFLTFDPEKGFEPAPDPELEEKKKIQELITRMYKQGGAAPKKTALVATVMIEVGISKNKTLRLLRVGEGELWKVEKGDKNASFYHPIQLSSLPDYIGVENWKTEDKESIHSEKQDTKK